MILRTHYPINGWRNVCGPIPGLDPQLNNWLLDQDSLTDKLIHASMGNFYVSPLRHSWQRISHSEAVQLNIRDYQWVRVREVLLCCYNEPWVYARTLFPVRTLTGKLGWLRWLNDRPLGALLFSKASMRRSHFEVARLDRDSGIPQSYFAEASSLWGRRSLFYLENKPMLVAEIFLPPLENYLLAENNL